MTAQKIDGKALSAAVVDDVRAAIPELTAKLGRPPGLTVVLVGQHPASVSYVTNKKKTAAGLGMNSVLLELPEDIAPEALSAEIQRLNSDPGVDGILLQLPLPEHLDEERHVQEISPEKDVDGLHLINIGRVWADRPGFRPCTPAGVQEMLVRSGIETEGANVVIVGRSNLVGKPLAALLSAKGPGGNATVTIAHSRTRDLPDVCRRADILVAAIGRPHFIKADWIKPGATVIDVGINRIEDASRKRGFRLVGDVDYQAALEVAGAITPVPGGVGPMTIAMLMQNTVLSARMKLLCE
jgi:methylenetetrahydrofolate dehydrogenase (NADP+)/methenyltetrahydrofolate cyclohydrolase